MNIGDTVNGVSNETYILRKKYHGGMAHVFLAKNGKQENKIVKSPRYSPEDPKNSRDCDHAIQRERIILSYAQGRVPAIEDDGQNPQFFVMPYVAGMSLGKIVESRKLGANEARIIFAGVCDTIQGLHDQGIIHRDVKPHNIQLSREGPYLLDFGLSWSDKVQHLESCDDDADGAVVFFGTPLYVSPESWRGERDARSDIYALGITLYQALTGNDPFNGETNEELAMQHCKMPITPPSDVNPRVPKDLSDIVLRATEKKQNCRFQSASEMKESLLKCTLTGNGSTKRLVSRVLNSLLKK